MATHLHRINMDTRDGSYEGKKQSYIPTDKEPEGTWCQAKSTCEDKPFRCSTCCSSFLRRVAWVTSGTAALSGLNLAAAIYSLAVERIDSLGERTSFVDFVPFIALGGLIGLSASYYKDKLNHQEKAAELAKKRNMHVLEFCHDIRGPLGEVIHGVKLIPPDGMTVAQEEALRLTKLSASTANDMVQNLLNSQSRKRSHK